MRRYLLAGTFPERASGSHFSRADPFADFIRLRWEQGCHNAAQIARELAARGFDGSYYIIRRRVARWRDSGEGESSPGRSSSTQRTPVRRPSSHRVAGWLPEDGQDLTPEHCAFTEALCQCCPELRTASRLARAFAGMLRQHTPWQLEEWIVRTRIRAAPRELKNFANGLKFDYAAVKAALTFRWSNGPVEGHINRLKLIKRQMYGRASFELLRQRVLHAE